MDKRVAASGLDFRLNGQPVSIRPQSGERLSATLREGLGARDVKVGCDAGDCGACTVLINGNPVCACLTPSHQAEGCDVDTLSGLVAGDPNARALAERFQDHGAAQCGICTPGMMVSAVALLRRNRTPKVAEVEDALGGVLCRCTGYRKIIDAVIGVSGPEGTGSGGVGASIRRRDGQGKVEGTERFGDDVAPPGTLSLRVIRSPFHHARFEFGDLDQWQALTPGIAAVLTARDVPGLNRFGVIPGFVDQPVFAEANCRFRGEAVAAIVGAPEAIDGFDVSSFPVTWQELPATLSMPEARADGAVPLHEDRNGNVMCSGFVARGAPQDALARADVVAAGRFTTSFVEHAYIEPEAGFAEMRQGRVEVHACTQAPVMDQQALADILAMQASEIRIVPTGVGGGFRLQARPFGATVSGAGDVADRAAGADHICAQRVDAIDHQTPPCGHHDADRCNPGWPDQRHGL